MVKLAYSLSGKGKGRKRPLSEILDLIENKEDYFNRNCRQFSMKICLQK